MSTNELPLLLTGKQLLLEEIPPPLHPLLHHPQVTRRPGLIRTTNNRLQCNRCGNHEQQLIVPFPCARCHSSSCYYCRACIMMGRVSSCSELFGWAGEPPEYPQPQLQWSGNLSSGQAVAAERVTQAIKEQRELLVWAVCGAGKTELLFPGIEAALTSGKRVCIATPRTDVVLELAPRLQQVFPSIQVASLYGGSEDRHIFSPLTISTTHQLIRFHEAFDTMIVDEVDAFPYTADPLLQFAVQHSRKKQSSMIYLTATPSRKWQKECQLGKRQVVTIPARFHRFPLPIPEFKWCGNWEKQIKKQRLPTAVVNWIKQRLTHETPVLLFVPKISLIDPVLQILQKLDERIEGVHSEDPNRKQKVQQMREKKIHLLVTTTILERGVTFPGLDVAVLGADEDIFTESALVQIAGRVGRSSQVPSGTITFFHFGKSEAMVRACKQMRKMNEEARKKGLLNP